MDNDNIDYRLRCSIQRAMLGEVDKRMVAVTCGVFGRIIRIRSYIDGVTTSEDLERIQRVGTEVLADFVDNGFTTEEECVSASASKLENLGFWAFYRADR